MLPTVDSTGSARVPAPAHCAPSVAGLLLGAAALGHAALVLAGVLAAPSWVPIVECLAASLVGLRQLRRVEEAGAPALEPVESAPEPRVPVLRASSFPARVAAPVESVETGGSGS